MDFPSPSILKQAFHDHFKVPVVFKNSLKSWKSVPWTSKELMEHYGSVRLNFRLVSKADKNISWERNAVYVEATISHFIEWQSVESSILQPSNPFHEFKAEEYWAYSSYNYMSQIFKDNDDILKAVDWSAFGYPETSLEDSAFWIGSEGANTPCHFDTYGFNFVAQIQGRKQWTLYPPDDTPFLYPTRIPFEESSVYSSVNILNPDFKTHPMFKFSHPHVLTLEPGDVLFVPNKWWHVVQSTDVSVSINSWIKLDSDKNTRLEEGITRAIMSSYISYFEPIGESWLNVGEELVLPEVAISYISTVLREIKSSDSKSDSQNKGDSTSSPKKISKTDFEGDVHSNDSRRDSKILCHEHFKYAVPVSFSNWFGNVIDSEPAASSEDLKLKDIIDCLVHPDVISEICKLLKRI